MKTANPGVRPSRVLVGERVRLQPLRETDLGPTYLAWFRDAEVTRYLEARRSPVTLSHLRQYLRRFRGSRTDFIFAILDRRTGLHVGNVTLNHIHPVYGTADTGILIGRKEYWGRGYATEAWSLLLDFAFCRMHVRKVVAIVAAEHHASLAVLKKLGFQEEGRFRDEILVGGAYQDRIRLGVFADECIRTRVDG